MITYDTNQVSNNLKIHPINANQRNVLLKNTFQFPVPTNSGANLQVPDIFEISKSSEATQTFRNQEGISRSMFLIHGVYRSKVIVLWNSQN